MTGADLVARSLELLRSAGYEQLVTPLTVATIPFDIGIPMVSTRSLNLVLVVDTLKSYDPDDIRRQTDGLSRALDALESRRSLTVIFVGPTPSVRIIDGMSRVARVLAVGTPVGERAAQDLTDRLAVLLPLSVRPHEAEQIEPWDEIQAALAAPYGGSEIESVFAATGEREVRDALERLLAEPLYGLDLA